MKTVVRLVGVILDDCCYFMFHGRAVSLVRCSKLGRIVCPGLPALPLLRDAGPQGSTACLSST